MKPNRPSRFGIRQPERCMFVVCRSQRTRSVRASSRWPYSSRCSLAPARHPPYRRQPPQRRALQPALRTRRASRRLRLPRLQSLPNHPSRPRGLRPRCPPWRYPRRQPLPLGLHRMLARVSGRNRKIAASTTRPLTIAGSPCRIAPMVASLAKSRSSFEHSSRVAKRASRPPTARSFLAAAPSIATFRSPRPASAKFAHSLTHSARVWTKRATVACTAAWGHQPSNAWAAAATLAILERAFLPQSAML